MGRKPKATKPALSFGDLIHQALEQYYQKGRKRGPHPATTFAQVYDDLTLNQGYNFGVRVKQSEKDDAEIKWTKARDLGIAMLNNYVETYGPEDNIDILVPEMPFRVNLYNPKNGKYVVTAVGKLDAVYRDLDRKKRLGIIDHKTAASISTNHLEGDEQAGTYFALAPMFLREIGLLGEKEMLRGILYNFLLKSFPDPRPVDGAGRSLNKDGSVSKNQPAKRFQRKWVVRSEASSQNVINRIVIQAWEMKQVRKGKLPIYKNYRQTCSAQCGFHDMCLLHESGGDWEELMELSTKPWNPHADHELVKKE